jgi:hypothetical protein
VSGIEVEWNQQLVLMTMTSPGSINTLSPPSNSGAPPAAFQPSALAFGLSVHVLLPDTCKSHGVLHDQDLEFRVDRRLFPLYLQVPRPRVRDLVRVLWASHHVRASRVAAKEEPERIAAGFETQAVLDSRDFF